MNELYYIGLDIHKKSITSVMKTPGGRLVRQGSIGATRAALAQGGVARGALVEHCPALAPGGPLAVVDLTPIQHAPLGHLGALQAAVFHHSAVAMLFAVLAPTVAAQKHSQ